MQLDELKRLHEAATPGSWDRMFSGNFDEGWYIFPILRRPGADCLSMVKEESNAALIAAMRNALPDLIAAVEELQNIARANTHDWDDPSDFEEWAKSRSRAILARLGVE